MHFRIQIITVLENGIEHQQEIADVRRSAAKSATIGLTLEESKEVLHELQQTMVEQQVTAYLEQQRPCPHCQKQRPLKQRQTAPFRTLFGTIQVPNPRWDQCVCQAQEQRTFRPLTALLPERTSPELLYLETKWASLASYGITAKLLHEVLPIDQQHSAVTVRNHLLSLAERSEAAMGAEQAMFLVGDEAERAPLPIPNGPLSVGLDGAIVRARRDPSRARASNLFEVIAGKSILSFRREDPADAPPTSKCFALVQSFDQKPKRRLFDLLQSQGLQANQQVTFFSDGGDTVRKLPQYLNPDSEHLLDWFHLTMRITVLQQCARGLQKLRTGTAPAATAQDEESLARCLASVKHYLWHGRCIVFRIWKLLSERVGIARKTARRRLTQIMMRWRECASMSWNWSPTPLITPGSSSTMANGIATENASARVSSSPRSTRL